MDKLKESQKKFCREYLKDFNATRAYIDAGYSKNGATQSASALLTNPNVQSYLSEQVKVVTENDQLQIRKIILELQMIAFGDLKDFAEWNATSALLKASSTLDEKSRVLSEVSQTTNGVKVKMHDKIKAIQLLGEYYKIWQGESRQADVTVNVSPQNAN